MHMLINYFEGLSGMSLFLYVILLIVIAVSIHDIVQRKHAIKHNFPLIGNFRYMLEKIGPELRQYIVANNREELPFNRSERSWIYASSKKENNYQGFGTDKDLVAPGHVFVNPSMFPYPVKPGHISYDNPYFVPCAKVIGKFHKRQYPYRPHSIINISAMSFGSLSANAIESLNKGALKVGCYHNTGEGSLSPYHKHGADMVFQIGTAYFGIRDEHGNFSLDKLVKLVEDNPTIKMIEIKLSQGAKPGKGGVLPAKKINKEISEIRGIPMGKDVVSPSYHTAFSTIPEMINFIEKIAHATGRPVGIKSAIGKLEMWHDLATYMAETNKGPDFITIDGGEGGTGAAPPAFADHVSLPFNFAFANIYKIFSKKGLSDKIAFIASGKLGLPANALKAIAMGADLINIAREAMMSIGCIQAQVCHTNRCPAGIATSNKWLAAGVDPALKSERFYNYIKTFRKEVLEITHACGYEHPCQVTMRDVDLSMGDNNYTLTLQQCFDYDKVPVEFHGMQSLKDCQYLGTPRNK
ncbi:FMN-binding glutamate synthase family protein [Chondrinema litorale]|uniref:FMN-binding glutamate synthase family protein n=1 Tax=Chondrinema litorale TaxID=2994555 RepID=UPI00254319CB|nr:FMN-binding glutamate synthase family protein [Chondrinema litorale]UZR94705.1 FMN-binding glutamate synthase family protein [Chondrinema litorale]